MKVLKSYSNMPESKGNREEDLIELKNLLHKVIEEIDFKLDVIIKAVKKDGKN